MGLKNYDDEVLASDSGKHAEFSSSSSYSGHDRDYSLMKATASSMILSSFPTYEVLIAINESILVIMWALVIPWLLIKSVNATRLHQGSVVKLQLGLYLDHNDWSNSFSALDELRTTTATATSTIASTTANFWGAAAADGGSNPSVFMKDTPVSMKRALLRDLTIDLLRKEADWVSAAYDSKLFNEIYADEPDRYLQGLILTELLRRENTSGRDKENAAVDLMPLPLRPTTRYDDEVFGVISTDIAPSSALLRLATRKLRQLLQTTTQQQIRGDRKVWNSEVGGEDENEDDYGNRVSPAPSVVVLTILVKVKQRGRCDYQAMLNQPGGGGGVRSVQGVRRVLETLAVDAVANDGHDILEVRESERGKGRFLCYSLSLLLYS
jgi:hypothetical protein